MPVDQILQTVTVTLAMGQGQIDSIQLDIGTTPRTYKIYPENEAALAYEGEWVNITPVITNIGDDATIYLNVTSPEVAIQYIIGGVGGYKEVFMMGGTSGMLDFICGFVMPAGNVSLSIEVGHL